MNPYHYMLPRCCMQIQAQAKQLVVSHTLCPFHLSTSLGQKKNEDILQHATLACDYIVLPNISIVYSTNGLLQITLC